MIQSPQVQPQPCPHLPLLISSSALPVFGRTLLFFAIRRRRILLLWEKVKYSSSMDDDQILIYFSLSMEISRLARDGAAGSVSRD